MSRILMPIPETDFDPTEVAVPWRLFSEAGHEVVFTTPSARRGEADPLVLRGVLFGQLGASAEAVRFYELMREDGLFARPVRWDEVEPLQHDALFLPGGHAAGMRPYLESEAVQAMTRALFAAERPIAAICHGVIVAARTRDPETGRSILNGRRSTCLPKYMERLAYYLTAWKLGRYYRTYPEYVEDEVRAALGSAGRFERGPLTLTARGTQEDDRPAFVVEDENYLSARWPGDAYLLAKRLLQRLEQGSQRAARPADARQAG